MNAITSLRAAAATLAATTLVAAPAKAAEPTENLDCIVFLSVALGTVEEAEPRIGIASALGWFIGQYEQQTGKPLGDELGERARSMSTKDLEGISGKCLPRMEAYGKRLSTLGERMTDSSSQ
ncbi:hypothetical protein [Qipengyuania flava]|uniref:hypothetical protein n=1 Tax=Qipengyuania flava TaxID=192812 RepID=UPI001C631EA6|nr:hypothetical protein [Qipengyuania flava]QYJ06279.1 hypothetical protein KUV82_09315 [Qipengyuania flava]